MDEPREVGSPEAEASGESIVISRNDGHEDDHFDGHSDDKQARSRLGLAVAVAGLAAGVAADGLLRVTPGLNVFLWVAFVLVGGAMIVRRYGIRLEGEGRWLLVPLVFVAASFAWRASPTLHALDTLLLLGTGCFVAMYAARGRLVRSSLSEYAWSLILGALYTMFSPIILITELDFEAAWPRKRWYATTSAVARGLLLALPLLLLFGALFMMADAAFAAFVERLLRFDLLELVTHIILIAFYAWLTCGLLITLLLRNDRETTMPVPARLPSLGITEIATVFGLLNVLFFVFVLLQFRYFFGGVEMIGTLSGLTVAEYARRGFFELIAVAAFLLPILLMGHWLLRKDRPAHEEAFRWLAGPLIGWLFVIIASALWRLSLYLNEYGLTELRLYATAFILWLAFGFLWLAATVLRGRRERFIFGLMVAGYVLTAALHIANPDALIARVNMERALRAEQLDMSYLMSLSADAVPVVVRSLPHLSEEQRSSAIEHLRQRYANQATDKLDWRSWNWGRERARRALFSDDGLFHVQEEASATAR